jgi:transposase
LLTSKKEKKKQVIKLAEEGKTTREIAKEVHISLKDIGKIIQRAAGDDLEITEKEKEKEKEKRLKPLSPYARAFQMFIDKLTLADVAIELDLDTDTLLNYYKDYLRLVRTNSFMSIYNELKKNDDFLSIFIHLYRRIKKEGLTKQDITDFEKSTET